MITHEEALAIILKQAKIVEIETVDIQHCVNRVLATDIFSDMNMPPFDKSAVDGYACRKEDLPGPLKVVEVITAGAKPNYAIEKGICAKIMTGAPVPQGADTVIMVEDTVMTEADTVQFISEKTATNICYIGEDIREGEKMLHSGTLLKPWHVAVLATVGVKDVLVYRKIKVGIITTGDELVEPGQPLVYGKIRNSNAYQLLASCASLPVDAVYYGIVSDDLQNTIDTLQRAIDDNDIVLLTGGVSMGDFDFVPQALSKAGLEILFDSVAMQPGRPLTFATNGKKYCFGLPGNPVSSMIQFEFSVKPLIMKLMNHHFQPVLIPLRLSETISRKKADRKSFYPVKLLPDSSVQAVEYHGSAHINAFSDAFGVIALEQGVLTLNKGTTVYVRPL